MKREHPGWNATHRQEWSLFLLEQMFHNAITMWHKEHQRSSHGLPLEPSEAAMEHLNVQTLVGSRDTNLLQVAELIQMGKCVVVPSVFTYAQFNDLMKEL